MNGITRKKVYAELSQRDGEKCQFCGRTPDAMQLVVDHVDNDNSNNDRQNLRLLCRRCNYIKNPRRPVDECVSDNLQTFPSEIQINKNSEPLFRKYVLHELNERKQISANELIYSGAEEVEISPITAKRYLDKMCSDRGILLKIKKVRTMVITYKPEIPYL